jgi:nitrate reductase NapE component
MLEDQELKALWQKGKVKSTSKVDFPSYDQNKSTGTILKNVRLILRIEMWINIVFFLPICYWFYVAQMHWLVTVFYTIITALYLFYYDFLIKKTLSIDFNEDVRNSLKKVCGYLSFYLLHYKVIIWISLIGGYAFGLWMAQANDPTPIEDPTKFWLVMVVVSIILIGIAGGFFHFLIHMIYGRKISRLKKIVKAFSD